MSDTVTLRAARVSDVERLTEIAHAAKAHWNYPPKWMELWKPSLTFEAALVRKDWVFVAELDDKVEAVVAIAGKPPTVELSHLWVDPPAMGRGLGRRLFAAALAHARKLGAERLEIIADPNAVEFYRRLGAKPIGEVESEPQGRRLPRMVREL